MSKSQEELTAGFIAPWLTEYCEVDGSRTYPVDTHRKTLLAEGVPAIDAMRASTVAALTVRESLFAMDRGPR